MRAKWWAVAVVGVLALSACTNGTTTDGGSETSPTDEVITDSGGQAVLGDFAPLTGRPLEGADLLRPALAAKVDNHPSARPQVAIDQADLVFEELVEGGLTRYVAVWHSDLPAEIGPVRSVRPMDPEIVSPLGGILAYSGGQQRFIDAMLESPVTSAIHGSADVDAFFYRSTDKVAPHNVIVRADELVANFADLAPPQPQFSYAAGVEESTAVSSGEPVATLGTRFSSFSNPSWEWSEAEGAFLRKQTNGAADVALSGGQIQADNVVVLFVSIEVIQDIPTTFLIDRGEGYVATGGYLVPVTWSKSSAEEPIELTDPSGQRVLLAPGKTWVELLPREGSGVPAGIVSAN